MQNRRSAERTRIDAMVRLHVVAFRSLAPVTAGVRATDAQPAVDLLDQVSAAGQPRLQRRKLVP
jgi:hypothetical protein